MIHGRNFRRRAALRLELNGSDAAPSSRVSTGSEAADCLAPLRYSLGRVSEFVREMRGKDVNEDES